MLHKNAFWRAKKKKKNRKYKANKKKCVLFELFSLNGKAKAPEKFSYFPYFIVTGLYTYLRVRWARWPLTEVYCRLEDHPYRTADTWWFCNEIFPKPSRFSCGQKKKKTNKRISFVKNWSTSTTGKRKTGQENGQTREFQVKCGGGGGERKEKRSFQCSS